MQWLQHLQLVCIISVLCSSYNDIFKAPSSPPQSVTATAVDPSSLRVTWQQPPEIDHNGPLTGYQIRYAQVGTSTSTVSASSTSYTLSGLTPYVQYTVQVAAVNSDGTGPFSSSLMSLSGQDCMLSYSVIKQLLQLLPFYSTECTEVTDSRWC